jgi:hypothetical protein
MSFTFITSSDPKTDALRFEECVVWKKYTRQHLPNQMSTQALAMDTAALDSLSLQDPAIAAVEAVRRQFTSGRNLVRDERCQSRHARIRAMQLLG